MTADDDQHEPAGARRLRLILGLGAAGLMTASGFFTGAVLGYADGTHSRLFGIENIGRTAILLLSALVAALLVLRPHKPDVRIARAGVLAVGLIGIVAGLEAFLGADEALAGTTAVDARPGPGAWILMLAGLTFVVLRWWGGLWPRSRWAQLIIEGRARRR